MANTFTELHYHCVFSTKNRENFIQKDIEKNVWAILAKTASSHGMHAVRIGGIENHVHVLLDIPKTLAVSEAMKRLKGGSSVAINESGISTRPFKWQDGYAAFTVSASAKPDVVEYIARQREHHRTRTFEEEYIVLLEKHGIGYDPKYLWG
ncbi:MAG: IS200/IS605 family transposase [Verrucomicrobiota bacterium]